MDRDEIIAKLQEVETKQDLMHERLAQHLDSDEDALSKINDQLDKMNDHLAEYNKELQIHIIGTIQNREAIVELKEMSKTQQEELMELRDLAKSLKTTWKVLSVVAVVVYYLVNFLHK